MTEARPTTIRRKRAGRPSDRMSPFDLPPDVRTYMDGLIVHAGCGASVVYERLGLVRLGINPRSLRNYVRKLRSEEGLDVRRFGSGTTQQRIECTARLLVGILSDETSRRVIERITRRTVELWEQRRDQVRRGLDSVV